MGTVGVMALWARLKMGSIEETPEELKHWAQRWLEQQEQPSGAGAR